MLGIALLLLLIAFALHLSGITAGVGGLLLVSKVLFALFAFSLLFFAIVAIIRGPQPGSKPMNKPKTSKK